MRYTADDTFWVVLDPTSASELADVCFAATLRDLEEQFRGGLSCDRSLALLTDRPEAEAEAVARIETMDAGCAAQLRRDLAG